jgi:ABC-type nickel/cobalt efflux system permease component RcnA
MVDTFTLMALSASAAILHTLVPDHEIPLAMIGRAKNWGIRQMTFWTLIAGTIHISFSMVIGVIALFASQAIAIYIAQATEIISGGLLVVFGAYFAITAWRGKGGHGHSHGPFGHSHARTVEEPHDHPHPHDETTHTHDDHTDEQTHADGSHTHGGQQFVPSAFDGSASMIAAITGIAPCFTLLPVLFAAVPYGGMAVFWVMVSYAVATIVSMVILTNIALKAINLVTRFAAIEKEIEILSGVIILIVGIWVLGEKYWLSILGF